jgi:predicted transcriptional regulator
MPETAMVTVKVSEETKSKLDRLCEENGLKMRWVVEQAILQYCEEHESKHRSEEK